MKALILTVLVGISVATTGAVSAHANIVNDLARTGSTVTLHGLFEGR
jgi:hypothetical protein